MEKRKMRVLVTGNLGYVGTVLTPMLRAAGHEVWGLDTGWFERCLLGPLAGPAVDRQLLKDVRIVKAGDLIGVDAVVHLAALSNDPMGELNAALTDAINGAASLRLARLAKAAGATRFLFASSCSIYGQSQGAPLTEDADFQPLTAYAMSKVRTERGLHELADDGFSPVALRFATAYGYSPRLRLDVVVNNLTAWAVTTGEVRLLSDGSAWRPLVHVEDMARAFLAALAAPRERIHDTAFNVGREEDNRRIRDLARSIAGITGCKVAMAEGASADARDYHVSFARIRERLPEFQPAWDVERGVRQLVEAFERYGLTRERFEGPEFTRLRQLQHLMESGAVDARLRWAAAARAVAARTA